MLRLRPSYGVTHKVPTFVGMARRIVLNVGGKMFETTVEAIVLQKGHALLHIINYEGTQKTL